MTAPRPPADGTLAAHAGLPPARPNEPPLPGPVFAAHYHLPGEPAGDYRYGRDANPTWTGLESALATLEAGHPEDRPAPDTGGATPAAGTVECVTFASGMAAVSAVLLSQVRAGDTVVLPTDCYYTVRQLVPRLEGHGARVRLAPTAGEGALRELRGARLVWLETPSNPGLDVCDIRRIADAAHAEGALVAVDNTLATPLGQRPLHLGADFSVASGTKALTGHGDLLLGYAAVRDPALAQELRHWRRTVGAVPGPMESWLAHRSLATLELRVGRQAENALAVATELTRHPEVTGVRHPGHPDDPGHPVAAWQMRRFGCVVSFTLPDRAHAEAFLDSLRLVHQATSFGGVRSTAERRARWGGDAVAAGFVRLSVGVEDPRDLVADVRQALDRARHLTGDEGR
ncbi:cystathionine gamma-lyase [Wenjunlia vitaminophila]|uniref:Cystathionine gamma-lyase n=1 Tax=Wenjunlia vitaminophila TaxID=76728 RepID=A0A0T6LMC1_WENVI|nr:cystathionine gamma-lyase [Wenjunlia vitaminophila]KRV47271.1 cystathionine gamma-lyase [Wenjunlia vitaminophila]